MNKKEELLALIHGNGYRGMHAAQLSRALDMEDSASFTQLMKLLNDLEAEHILARDAKERYFRAGVCYRYTTHQSERLRLCGNSGYQLLYRSGSPGSRYGSGYCFCEDMDKQ